MTGSVKTQHNSAFLSSCLLNIYNLVIYSQVYPLAKFQPHAPITLRVTALQSSGGYRGVAMVSAETPSENTARPKFIDKLCG